jgi:lysophospholipase L1-like esterase
MFSKYIFKILSIISVLLIFYIAYKSEIYWDGNQRKYYSIYFFISFSILLFSIIAYNLKKEYRLILSITIFSVIFSFYFFEVYLTIAHNKRDPQLDAKIKIYEKDKIKKFDTRSKMSIFIDEKSINKNTVVTVYPSSYYLNDNKLKIFPLSGISNSITIDSNENGYYFKYKSDRYGFNNPDEEWNNYEIKYLLLGDSFTHGCCVNRPNDIASVLRNLSKKPTINLGYVGNGPLIQFASLKEYMPGKVEKILWFYFEGNDISDLNRDLKNKILLNYIENKEFIQNLKRKQNEINTVAQNKIEEELNKFEKEKKKENFLFKTKNFLKIFKTREYIKNFFKKETKSIINKQEPYDEFKKILSFTKEIANLNNSELYFIYLPEYQRFKDKNYNNKHFLNIKQITKELEIKFINITKEVFEKQKNPLDLFPFQMYGHYNEKGYMEVAKKIFYLTN